MRRYLFLASFLLLPLTSTARAEDGPVLRWLQQRAQRTPAPLTPVEHTMERAGNPQSVRSRAIPTVTRFDYAGYVGGGSIRNNNLMARGPGSAVGPIQTGTF